MTLNYNSVSGSEAHVFVQRLQVEKLAATVGKYRLSGYPVVVHAEDVELVDAIARSVSSRVVRVQ